MRNKFALSAILLIVGLCATGCPDQRYEKLPIGSKMPELTALDLNGLTVELSDYKDKVIVLDIWATWCPSCRAMIPHERKLVERLKDKPFVLISVCVNEHLDELKSFLKEEKMPWVQWFAGQKSDLQKIMSNGYIPAIFILDDKGIVRYKNVLNEQDLDDAVDTLIKEAESKR